MQNYQKRHQSRFLEAPFVRMLRMRSASLKTTLILKITFIPKKQFEKPKLTSRTTSARSMKPKLLSSWIELTTPWYLTGAAGFSRRMVRATRLPLRAIVAI